MVPNAHNPHANKMTPMVLSSPLNAVPPRANPDRAVKNSAGLYKRRKCPTRYDEQHVQHHRNDDFADGMEASENEH